MLDSEYDVIVVGAGPGGSATAKRCAELGLKVAMLEKRQEIGAPKRCGEGLGLDAAERLGQKIPRYCIMQDINGSLVYAPNGKKITIDYGKTAGYVLERKQYDKWLAEEAARAGAKVQAKTGVTGVRKEKEIVNGVDAEFESEKFFINSKVVVAADGVESKVARWAGMNTTNKLVNIDSGFQYEMVDIEIEDPHKIILYFDTKMAPRGYLWIFPKGEDKANVGIGIGGLGYGKNPRQFLEEWIKTMPGLKKGSVTEVNAGGIPVGGFLDNMVMNGLVVVGDAAHQVNPIHGGGLREAAVAGKIAGEVITEAIKAGDVSQKKLSKYNDIWWKERGNHLMKVQKLREVVEKLTDDDLNMLVDALSGEDLVEFTRGGSLGKLAKILMKKPKLALLGRHLL